MSKEFIKPFNVDHARAGAPYCCRNRAKAEVLKWDRNTSGVFKLAGVWGPEDSLIAWTMGGEYAPSSAPSGTHPRDLVMLPLATVDGKPAFVGDELVSSAGNRFVAQPHHAGIAGCSWPAPAKEYPVTMMSGSNLELTYAGASGGSYGSFIAVANAALKHAVDAGQVLMLPCPEIKQALLLLDYMAEDQGNLAMSGDNLKDWRAIRGAAWAALGGETK